MVDYADWGEKPLPVIDPDSRPYWEAARSEELVVQRCADCGERQLYPRALCRHCWSRELAVEPVPGAGTVYSYTVCHVAGQPGYEEETPYPVALVELDLPAANPSGRPVRLTTHVVDVPADELTVGLEVEVAFRSISDDPAVRLPVFEPA